jgi:GT2 family glycosyltransferase
MPSERKISVIIPTWTRGDLLRKCLDSLRRQSFSDVEVVIVSNGAGNWAQNLAQEFGCKLIRIPKNQGFATAVNLGLHAGKSPYVMILNDDAVLDEKWLEKTIAMLEEEPSISFCCGKILQLNGRAIDDAGNALSMGGGAWRLGHGRPDGPDFDHPKPLIAVGMTAALFRRSVFEKVGNLDERFISYLEDVDLSIRLWRAGLRGMYVPQAVARHHGGASSGGAASSPVVKMLTRNQTLLLHKHYPGSLWIRLSPRIYWAELLWELMAIKQGNALALLSGSLSAFKALPGIRKDRQKWNPKELETFVEWLRASERAIYEDISARPRSQQDTYWRMYFALFRPNPSTTPAEIVDRMK